MTAGQAAGTPGRDSFDSDAGRTHSGQDGTAGQADPWAAWYDADAAAHSPAQDFRESKYDAMHRAFIAGAEARQPQGQATPGQAALRDVLRDHYLMNVVCDSERKQDNPVCQCSRVHLGWHPSIGAAVEAWIDHVMGELPGVHYEKPGTPYMPSLRAMVTDAAGKLLREADAIEADVHLNKIAREAHAGAYRTAAGRIDLALREGRGGYGAPRQPKPAPGVTLTVDGIGTVCPDPSRHRAEPQPAPGVTANRLGHALAALREIYADGAGDEEPVQRARDALDDDAALRNAQPGQPAPGDAELRRRIEQVAQGLEHRVIAGSRTRMAVASSSLARILRDILAETAAEQQPGQPAPELARTFQGQEPRADGITTSASGHQPAPELAAVEQLQADLREAQHAARTHRERLRMLVADTPFEFRPDWAAEYEDETGEAELTQLSLTLPDTAPPAAPELAAEPDLRTAWRLLEEARAKLAGVRSVCEGAAAGNLADTPRGRLAKAVLGQLDGKP